MKVNLEYIKKRFKGNPVVKCLLTGSEYQIESNSIRLHHGVYVATVKGQPFNQILKDENSNIFAEIIKQQEIVIPKENTKYSDLIRELSNLEGKVLITSEKIGNRFIYTIEEID